jgi:hypothetical protein
MPALRESAVIKDVISAYSLNEQEGIESRSRASHLIYRNTRKMDEIKDTMDG